MDFKAKTTSPKTHIGNQRQYKAYNRTWKKYNLCLNEKLAIINHPDQNLLNKKSEVISQCRHGNKFELVNLTSLKTPSDVM